MKIILLGFVLIIMGNVSHAMQPQQKMLQMNKAYDELFQAIIQSYPICQIGHKIVYLRDSVFQNDTTKSWEKVDTCQQNFTKYFDCTGYYKKISELEAATFAYPYSLEESLKSYKMIAGCGCLLSIFATVGLGYLGCCSDYTRGSSSFSTYIKKGFCGFSVLISGLLGLLFSESYDELTRAIGALEISKDRCDTNKFKIKQLCAYLREYNGKSK